MFMGRDRKKNREKKKIQQMLDRNNEFGIHDPTPRAAVIEIIERDKRKEKKQWTINI